MVYMRVPDVKLPAVPRPVPAGGDPEEKTKEKELFAAWIVQVVSFVRAEFRRLLTLAGSETTLNSTDFARIASEVGVATPVSGRRLFHAFAANENQLESSNRCGCSTRGTPTHFSFVNALEMLGHGVFPDEDAKRGQCFSSTRSCTLTDI